MTQAEVEAFIEGLEDVQRAEAFGYTLFFVGDDRRLPFVTIADSDQEFDNVSNLDRDGVFRINIGVSKATFTTLLGDPGSENVDHRVLDRFLPHPHYSKQNWVCILNPGRQNTEPVKELIAEAHAIATARMRRQKDR
ncbi:MAG TPA: DUF6194 family protein [Longimicrobiales bacterium]